MDPVAHTLVGATLAETALRRKTPLATATLLIGVNLPDVDWCIAQLYGRDFSLGFRRGWTHGILALIILPILLALAIYLFDHVFRRRSRPTAPRALLGPLVGLACLSVFSHSALDWLNNYGVRLLMPFDGRWFYGDTLFIIDPWIWLLAGVSPVLAHTRTPLSVGMWILLGLAMTLLIVDADLVPTMVMVVWIVGLTAIVTVRVLGLFRNHLPRVAMICGALAVTYIVGMMSCTWIARRQAKNWLGEQGVSPNEIIGLMAAPLPANPFVRDVIVVTSSRYYFLEIDWLSHKRVRVSAPSRPNGPPSPTVQAALNSLSIQGMRRWLRFPSYEVETIGDIYRVIIHDLRYSRMQRTGIGTAVVELDQNLEPR